MRQIVAFIICFIYCNSFSQSKTPFVLGNIEEIQSKVLSEKRILNIYLPDGYNANDTIKYPVIYLLDGSADEDFIHVAGLVQFSTFSWVNVLPKSILVGIANVNRQRDFTYPTTDAAMKKEIPAAGHSAAFISFIESELQPFINSHYKTNSQKTIIGQSLGGLLATEILLTKPQLFTKYIIISPSMWWDNESLLKRARKSEPIFAKVQPQVYVAVGSEGKIMIGDAKDLVKFLQRNNVKTTFHFFKKENHASIMHKAVDNAFETFNVKEKNHAN